MYYIIDNKITDQRQIPLDIYSPFLHTGQGLRVSVLYYNGRLLWFDEHLARLGQDAQNLGYEPDIQNIDQEIIFELLEKNDLAEQTALVKILCLKQIVGCTTLITAFPYSLPWENVNVALHNEPFSGRYDRFSALCQARDIYWLEYYGQRLDTDQVLFVNNKGRIIRAFEANVIAWWNRNFYYVHPSQNYRQTIIQEKILKNASRLGIKKIIDKGKGLSVDLLERADEVLLISDIFIARTVETVVRPSAAMIQTSQKAIKNPSKSLTLTLRNFFLENTKNS